MRMGVLFESIKQKISNDIITIIISRAKIILNNNDGQSWYVGRWYARIAQGVIKKINKKTPVVNIPRSLYRIKLVGFFLC